MVIEAGLPRAPPVLFLDVAGERHQEDFFKPGALAQLACDFVAIHKRQADVQKYHVRPKRLGCLQCREAA